MKILLICSGLLILASLILLSYILWKRTHFHSWVQRGETWVQQPFDSSPIDSSQLPPLVQSYLKKVIKTHQAPQFVSFDQEGVMYSKPGANEISFVAQQFISLSQPGFSWFARFPMGPLDMLVCDRLIGIEGELHAALLGSFTLIHLQGPDVLKGQLQRYLAEIAWAPHAILNNKFLTWKTLNEKTVLLTATVGAITASVEVEFDQNGLISKTSAFDRPREVDGLTIPTPWVGVSSDYRELSGTLIPTRAEVSWIIDSVPFTYFKGTITKYQLRSL